MAPLGYDLSRNFLDSAITEYYDDIRAAVRRRGLDYGQDSDVVHDLYLRLSRKPEKLIGRGSLRAFLIRAAINLGIDRVRRSAFEARLFESLDIACHEHMAAVAPDDLRLDAPRRLAALRRAILELPPQCRIVFIAYRVAGMSKDEIADQLKIRRGMVNRHLRRAMLHCMDRMDAFDHG